MIRLAIVLVLTITAAAASLPTTIVVQSSTAPAILGHAVTLTATVSPAAATGSVVFYDGTSILGSSHLFQGRAVLTTILLPSGTGLLKVLYSGDNSYQPSISPLVPLTISALPGNGFQTIVNYSGATNSAAVATGDFNGDGHQDLAIVNPATNPSQVLIFLGNGDGSFQTLSPASYPAGAGANSIALGDFNGDGITDLAVVNGNDNTVSILLGLSYGLFEPAVAYATGPSPDGIAVGDLNNDGIADLAVATASGVSVLIGVGDGTFRAALNHSAGVASSVALGEFNGDGRTDAVIGTPNGIVVLLGVGDGTFQNNSAYPTGVGGGPVVIADFNGDGKLDIAAAAGGSVSVVLGNGDGTFQASILSASSGSNASIQTLAAGDFNGDGKADLVAANYGALSGTNVSVLLGTGNGAFQTPVYYPVTAVTFAAVGDFNGDGVVDLVTAGQGPVGVLLGIPAAVVNPPPPTPPVPVVATGGVLNGASFQKDANGHGTPVAPGSLVSIFGTFPGTILADAATAPFGTLLGGASVTFNGIAAPLRDMIPASGEINAQIPFEVATGSSSSPAIVNVVVTTGTGPSAPVSVPIVPAAPGIFTIPPTGLGNAVLVFVDPADGITKIAAPTAISGLIGSPIAPIPRGQSGYFYATGLGVMSPPVADGDGGLGPPVVTHFATKPIVLVGGINATVQFAGQAPGYPGVNQINIQIPASAPTGDGVPIQIQTPDGTIVSNTATIAIR